MPSSLPCLLRPSLARNSRTQLDQNRDAQLCIPLGSPGKRVVTTECIASQRWLGCSSLCGHPRTQARLHVVIQHHGGNFGNLSFCRRCTLNATHSPCAGRLRMRCFQDRQDCSHQCQLQRSQVSPAAGLNTHPSSCQESTQAPCQCLADAAGSTAPVSELQAPRIILPEIFQPCPVW